MPLNAEDRDPSVDPGEDFYRYANGGWIDANPIPPGYGSWGSLEEIHTANEDLLHRLLVSGMENPRDDLHRKVGDYFASGMDTERIEAVGLAPIQPLLDEIGGLREAADVIDLLPTLHRFGIPTFFGWATEVDHEDSSRNLLWIAQAGLGLPERDSYFNESEAASSLREAYVAHVAAQLRNVGWTDSEAAASGPAVLAFETLLAEKHLRAEDRRDLDRTLNRHDLVALANLSPTWDLPRYLQQLGAGAAVTVNVENPDYVAALEEIVDHADPATLRAYLTFHVIRATADALPAAIDDEAFEFYGRRIEGKKEQKEHYKRVISALGSDMGEALGRLYVEEAFPPEAKDRALAMVAQILAEMRRSLETRPWMDEHTRAQGLIKLDALTVKIGYPDAWRDWSALEIDRRSYLQNRINSARLEVDRQLAKISEPVDRGEWEMPPHVVNAYYHPFRNEIVFPAGILQPPLFDVEADDALNYGGIGTVIAHEITHGFDDQGRRFDENGAFRDWWTAGDQEHFNELAEELVAQYDAYEVLDGVHVNGRLTLGENIADLGGVALAQRAHARVSQEQPRIDGLSPVQRFYLANATVWRGSTSDELARTLVQIDPHSPTRFRVVGPFSNQDAFQEAFDIADDAPMIRPREERIEIW